MDFESIILIDKDNNTFLEDEFNINVHTCFENIKSFYKKGDKIFLVLNLENDYSDEEFFEIIEEFPYTEFESLDIEVYPMDDEYYPTFIFEFNYEDRDKVQYLVSDILEMFMEKVVKIYCNNM